MIDAAGVTAAQYSYDAWGNILSAEGTEAAINPIRYRGYYYDTETGLYYLQSRYYDAKACRWICADDTTNLGTNGDFNSLNLYVYCGNYPVDRADDGGECWHVLIGAAVGGAFEIASQLISNGGNLSDINWQKVGIATAVGGMTALTGPISSAIISGIGNGLMEYAGGTTDIKKIAVSAIVGVGASFVGYGVGKAAQKIGGKIAVNNLSKKSPGQIKRVVNSIINVAGTDRNKVKNLSWTLTQSAYKCLPDALIGKSIPQFFNSIGVGIAGYGTMGGIYGFT